jgi:hypothetical protein
MSREASTQMQRKARPISMLERALDLPVWIRAPREKITYCVTINARNAMTVTKGITLGERDRLPVVWEIVEIDVHLQDVPVSKEGRPDPVSKMKFRTRESRRPGQVNFATTPSPFSVIRSGERIGTRARVARESRLAQARLRTQS